MTVCVYINVSSHHFTSLHTITIYVPSFVRSRPVSLHRWLSVGIMVTIRSSVGCKYRQRAPRQIIRVARVWRLVWTARALDRFLIRCSAQNMGNIVIDSAHQRCRVFVVRCCVTAELVDFDCDSRTDGSVYKAALFIHFRPSFLEFLRVSKTLL